MDESEGATMEQINSAAGLVALPAGSVFQDKYGYVWQKNNIQCTDLGHGNPVDIYQLMGSHTIAVEEQVIDWAPLTVLATELPVEPRTRVLPRNTSFPWSVMERLGITEEALAAHDGGLSADHHVRVSDR